MSKHQQGIAAAGLSAVIFYIATVFISDGAKFHGAPSTAFVFARFFVGLFIMAAWFGLFRIRQGRHYPIVWSSKLAWGRAVTNFVAVYCFFRGLSETTVANANLLNLTYPVFVALITVALWRRRIITSLFTALLCFTGIVFITYPDAGGFGFGSASGDYWSLASGVVAATSVFLLNRVRQTVDSLSVLVIVFIFGSIGSLVFFPDALRGLTGAAWFYVIASAALGAFGQGLLTYSLRFITAIEGSVISSSRILIATLAGPFLYPLTEPWSLYTLAGAACLFAANTLVVRSKTA